MCSSSGPWLKSAATLSLEAATSLPLTPAPPDRKEDKGFSAEGSTPKEAAMASTSTGPEGSTAVGMIS